MEANAACDGMFTGNLVFDALDRLGLKLSEEKRQLRGSSSKRVQRPSEN